MNRPTAEKRHLDYIKAIRKRRIDREVEAASIYHHDWYDNLHQYSKNKIHCSCPLCASKTKNKGRKKNKWGPVINWKPSDKRKIEELKYQEDDE